MVLPNTFLIGLLWPKGHLREMEEILTLHVTDYDVGVNVMGCVSCDVGNKELKLTPN